MNSFLQLLPTPKFDKIIEPFGFPAEYSLIYHEKNVLINDFSIEEFIPEDDRMKHWQFSHKPYYNLPNEEATWFIDPSKNKKVDFVFLANWCKNRKGQVIVIEQSGATWMKFKDVLPGKVFWSNFSIKNIKTQLNLWK